MWWLTLPLVAVNISIIVGIVALREKWSWATVGILVVNICFWLVIWNTILDDVAEAMQLT